MIDKQEIFEAFCRYCTDPAEEDVMAGWASDMRKKLLEENFAFYFGFFKEYMPAFTQSPRLPPVEEAPASGG